MQLGDVTGLESGSTVPWPSLISFVIRSGTFRGDGLVVGGCVRVYTHKFLCLCWAVSLGFLRWVIGAKVLIIHPFWFKQLVLSIFMSFLFLILCGVWFSFLVVFDYWRVNFERMLSNVISPPLNFSIYTWSVCILCEFDGICLCRVWQHLIGPRLLPFSVIMKLKPILKKLLILVEEK